jgi:hypothetical protein
MLIDTQTKYQVIFIIYLVLSSQGTPFKNKTLSKKEEVE